jgi:uridine kinase
MRVIDIEDITESMDDQLRFVLHCEEVYRDKISTAAAKILRYKDSRPIVCLTGPSGSGKTTTAMRLRAYLENMGVPVGLVSMDNFFLPLDRRPPEAADWESPYCVDRERLADCILRLADGETVEAPVYDFKSGTVGGTKTIQGDKDGIIIAEGIHMLNPLILDLLKGEYTGVYVAPRTRIITHEDRIVNPEQLRVARRMIRDLIGRGHSLRSTVERAQDVDRGELNYIQPNKTNAVIHIDTFHDYEPCILSKYLLELPEFHEQLDDAFIEQHGLTDLMKVVKSVPPLTTPYVPKNSLVREFVGGSIFEY